MGQTVVEKLAERHHAGPPVAPGTTRAGDYLTLRPVRLLSHDNTAAIMRKFHEWGATSMTDPGQAVIALDHDIQNRSADTAERYAAIEAFAAHHGAEFHPAGSGIGHQLMVECLHVLPGTLVVAADSHANMYGALGALGTAVTRSDAAAIWATGTLWWEVPRTVRVFLTGALQGPATGKDVILALCARYASGEVAGAAIEFAGPGLAGLDLEARLTIANMTTEWDAVSGWFPADAVAWEYLRRRQARLAARPGLPDVLAAAEAPPVAPDPDARYAGEIRLDLSSIVPHVSGPNDLQTTTALPSLERQRIVIQKAYLVSCVNARAGDLQAAAEALAGRPVAPGVELYIAAASAETEREAAGAWRTLLDAGARPLPSGCGPCIGLGAGLLQPGEVGISASNRNFRGRMGSTEARCYLASPAVVAASAAAGFVCGPPVTTTGPLVSDWSPDLEPSPAGDEPPLLPGFPSRHGGRVVFLPHDHLDTDAMYAKDNLYRNLSRKRMAEEAFRNYDPTLAGRLRRGDVLVGGLAFGSGSSREQAVTALAAHGIGLVVAAGFSSTYLRNAFNNGMICVVCPDWVEHLRRIFAAPLAALERSISPGDSVDVDFEEGTLGYRGRRFRVRRPGPVLQSLVVAGGLRNRVRRELGLT